MTNYDDDGLPLEEFIQALTSQLDRAQATMALKAQAGLPLTFAVKDISIDLRAHVNMERNRIVIRPAGPGDGETSVLHIALTTITRPMIEENTVHFEPDEPALRDVLGDDFNDEDRRRLEWAGIRTVSQLRDLQRSSGEHVIEQIAQIPALRLRQALDRAAQPHISRVSRGDDGTLRVRGLNLAGEAGTQVRIGGEQVTVIEASDKELILAPSAHQFAGTLAVELAPGMLTQTQFDLAGEIADPHRDLQHTPRRAKSAVETNGGRI